jgi:glycosyltransferase involved in cell wall biosynthesis
MKRCECQVEVSIILPVFNRAHLVAEAVKSVLLQSFENFELIIIDDGSTDATVEIINTFDDPRIILLRQQNRGRSVARNQGLAIAQGRYIAFLDSDDVYREGKLGLQVAYMDKHREFDMIYTSAHCIDSNGDLLDEQPYLAHAEGNIYKHIAFFQPLTITLPTVMLRREVLDELGGFDVAMERFEDTDLWRRIAKRYRVGAINVPTCLLRTHENNALSAQDPEKIRAAVDYYVVKVFREDMDADAAFLRKGASQLYAYYAKALLSIPGWHSYGFYMLKKAVSYRPASAGVLLINGMRIFILAFVRQRFGLVK